SVTASDPSGNRSAPASLDVTTAACPPSPIRAPFAGGDAAANIPLNSAGARVLERFVAGRAGTLDELSTQVKVDSTPCSSSTKLGYAAGSGGMLHAALYAVRADGTPDTSRLLASDEFSPCSRLNVTTVALDLNVPVSAGQELALVVSNADPNPAANFFSV